MKDTSTNPEKQEAMKTTKILAALSLALMIFGMNTGFCAKTDNGNALTSAGGDIRYQVRIHIPADAAICNTYLVQLLDKNGRPVAPAQTYMQGTNQYDFYETGPVTGIRIARIVLDPHVDHIACPTELFCDPAVRIGTFLGGKSYPFDLYPTKTPQKD
jgi:hypothetical protein